MKKFSKNTKLNGVLNEIYEDLHELGLEEVKRYYNEYRYETDYNIAQYGNLLCYYYDIFELYRRNGYKTTDKYSSSKIWDLYKRQVGYIARLMIHNKI